MTDKKLNKDSTPEDFISLMETMINEDYPLHTALRDAAFFIDDALDAIEFPDVSEVYYAMNRLRMRYLEQEIDYKICEMTGDYESVTPDMRAALWAQIGALTEEYNRLKKMQEIGDYEYPD